MGHISDVHVVAALLPGAVYRRGFSRRHVAAEDGHHPSLTVRVLPRPVDVGVAQSHVRNAVLQVIEIEVTLPGELRDSVWGEWVLRMILARRKRLLPPVDSPAGRGEDDLPHTVLDAVLEEADGAQYIYFCIEVRLSDRTPDIHLGSLMAQCLWGELLENAEAPGADVLLVEASPYRDVLSFSAGEVVHDGHLVAPLEQALGHVRADEPSAAGEQDPHRVVGASRRSACRSDG